MRFSSKLIVLLILGLAVGLAGFNLVYQHQRSRRSLAYFGTDAGQLISTAPCAELRRLTPSDGGQSRDDAEIVTLRGRDYRASPAVEISQARGFSHVRRAFLIDATFAWDSPPPASPPNWRYALEFSNGQKSCLLLLDEPCLHVALDDRSDILTVRPSGGKSPLAPFFIEQYANE